MNLLDAIKQGLGGKPNPETTDEMSLPGTDETASKRLVKWLYDSLYSQAEKYDKPYSDNRKDNIKFYKGDQWRRKQPKNKSTSVTNITSLIVRDECAILTDSLPTINIKPVDFQADPSIAIILKKLVDHILYKNNFKEQLHETVKMADITGVDYIYPYWDDLYGEGGDVRICLERADAIKRDPSGEDNYFCIEKKVSMAEIMRRYPDKIDQVRTEKTDERQVTNASTDSKNPPMPVRSTDGSEVVSLDTTSTNVMSQYDKVALDIWWLRDESVKEIKPENTDNTEAVEVEQQAMYPHGRWLVIANRKTIMEDKPCMVRHFPIVPLIMDQDPETKLSGIGVIDYFKQLQVDYNEAQALIKDWFRATVYPKFTYDPRTTNPLKVKNRWGVGNPGGQGAAGLRWDNPPSLPNELFTYVSGLRGSMEYVSALNDISQGRRPASVTSAAAIKLLQEASKTVLRPKARLIESAVKKVGELIIDYIQAGYTTPRIMRLIGGEEISVNNITIVDNVEKITNNLTIGEYDVRVEPDSTLPTSDIERMDRLIQMADLGFADRQAILSKSGLEDWPEIEARMAQKEQEAKAMMAQGQPGQPGQEPVQQPAPPEGIPQ